jgi:hypothetical protein
MNIIGWISCAECGGDNVSDSPNSPFPAYCWDCQRCTDIIVRIDKE